MKDQETARRHFLKTGLTILGGTTLGLRYANSLPFHFGSETVRIGVIGTGGQRYRSYATDQSD